jgi:hypothetical protein
MNTCLCPPDARSVHAACVEEEDRFKWIESEKVGYDLGESAIRRWVNEHWTGYLRARWVEHLQGTCFWIELDNGDFGLLLRKFEDKRQLLDVILGLLKSGKENLDVIIWAKINGVAVEPVFEILEALDVNSRRLAHRFESRF